MISVCDPLLDNLKNILLLVVLVWLIILVMINFNVIESDFAGGRYHCFCCHGSHINSLPIADSAIGFRRYRFVFQFILFDGC